MKLEICKKCKYGIMYLMYGKSNMKIEGYACQYMVCGGLPRLEEYRKEEDYKLLKVPDKCDYLLEQIINEGI